MSLRILNGALKIKLKKITVSKILINESKNTVYIKKAVLVFFPNINVRVVSDRMPKCICCQCIIPVSESDVFISYYPALLSIGLLETRADLKCT